MSSSKDSNTSLTLPNLGDLPSFSMRPNSPDPTPITWTNPNAPRKPSPRSKPKLLLSMLSSIVRSRSQTRSETESSWHPSESDDDESYFKALEVSLCDISQYREVSAFTPAFSSAEIYILAGNHPGYLVLNISSVPKEQGDPVGRTIDWELKLEKYKHWRGKYCICFSEGHEKFYVLKHGRTRQYKGRRFVLYENVPMLSKEHINPEIDEWLDSVVAYLKNSM